MVGRLARIAPHFIVATIVLTGCGNSSSTRDSGVDSDVDSGADSSASRENVDSGADSSSASEVDSGLSLIFNCGAGTPDPWSAANAPAANGCGVSTDVGDGESNPHPGTNFSISNGGAGNIGASALQLVPADGDHAGWGIDYSTAVNDQAFTTTFTFIPNGFNIVFVVNNDYSSPPATSGVGFPWGFNSGAGGEAGLYQGYDGLGNVPINVWALELGSYDPLTVNGTFNYSNAQIYEMGQNPSGSDTGGIPDYWTNKVSTSPVPLNNPVGTRASPSTDTFSATITYNGTNVTLQLFDVTAGGACPSAKCFTYTWQGVNIPGVAGGPYYAKFMSNNTTVTESGAHPTTGWVGFTAGTSLGTGPAEQLLSWKYAVLSPAASPTFSPAAGKYASTQTVTISAPSGSTLCYSTAGPPSTDGVGGCARGTLYSGPFSVISGETLYAVAGGSSFADSPVSSAAYQIGSTASQPVFSVPGGTYQGAQTLYLSSAQATVICYNTTGAPASNGSTGCSNGTVYTGPITISSNETVYASGGGTGLTNSAVNSAAYVISPFAGSGAATPAASPVFSVAPGSYQGTQTVSLSTATTNAYICYVVEPIGTNPYTFDLPQPNNGATQGVGDTATGSCNTGTLYSSPIPVASSETVYAITGTTFTAPPSSVSSATYVIGP